MFELLEELFIEKVSNLTRLYYKNSDIHTDICIVKCNKDKSIEFKTSTAEGKVDRFNIIRRLIGQNKLHLLGPASLSKIILLVSPSCLRYRPIDTIKFIKEWPGNSKLEDNIVILYKNIWNR